MFPHMGEDYLSILEVTLSGNVLKYISYFNYYFTASKSRSFYLQLGVCHKTLVNEPMFYV